MMFKHSKLRQTILLALSMGIGNSYAAEFNTDVLDAEDMNNIDMSQFSVAGYVPPGDYVLTVFVNGQRLGEPRDVAVFDDNSTKSVGSQQVCLAPQLLDFMGLKKSAEEKVTLFHDEKCLNFSALAGYKPKWTCLLCP